MRIIVHASLDLAELMIEAKRILPGFGCDVILPTLTRYQHIRDELGETERFSRIQRELLLENGRNVAFCDGLLIINPDHRAVRHYVGGTAFFEMCLAFHLGKPIFLTHGAPTGMPYSEEIAAFFPIVVGPLSQLTKGRWDSYAQAAGLH